MDFCLK